jgi:hypothetical protein
MDEAKPDLARTGGRPLIYRDYFAITARERCGKGATLTELAPLFGVERRTAQGWMRAHPAFGAAVREGRADFRAKVDAGEAAAPKRRWSAEKKKPQPQGRMTRIVFRYVTPNH